MYFEARSVIPGGKGFAHGLYFFEENASEANMKLMPDRVKLKGGKQIGNEVVGQRNLFDAPGVTAHNLAPGEGGVDAKLILKADTVGALQECVAQLSIADGADKPPKDMRVAFKAREFSNHTPLLKLGRVKLLTPTEKDAADILAALKSALL